MPLLHLSLSLDPPPMYASYCACFIAFCVATLATFSRFSLLSFVMENGLISPKLHYHQLCMRGKSSSLEAIKQIVASKQADAQCVDPEEEEEQEEEEKGREQEAEENPWHQSFSGGRGGGDEVENEEDEEGEDEKGTPPSWMFTLLESSAAYPGACLSQRNVLKPRFTGWSRDVERRIFMRVGKDWQVSKHLELPWQNASEPEIDLAHVHTDVEFVECECTRETKEEVLHPSSQRPGAKYFITTCNGGAYLKDGNGMLALWDLKRSLCFYTLPYTQSMAFSQGFSRAALATGPYPRDVRTTVVRFWDNRCPLRSGSLLVMPAASPSPALKCNGNEVAVAGKGVISVHDIRMPSRRWLSLYSSVLLGKGDKGLGQGRIQRGRDHYYYSDVEELDINHTPAPVVGEQEVRAEMEMEMEMDKPTHSSINIYESFHHHNSKTSRKASFLIHCLYVMLCLPEQEE